MLWSSLLSSAMLAGVTAGVMLPALFTEAPGSRDSAELVGAVSLSSILPAIAWECCIGGLADGGALWLIWFTARVARW